jgi:hypothetical protein
MRCCGVKSKQAAAVDRDGSQTEPMVPRQICTLLQLIELPNVPVAAAAAAALHICTTDNAAVRRSICPLVGSRRLQLSAQGM